MSKGLYIIFEGIVGAGKSTQVRRLTQHLETRYKNRAIINTFEPGGSEIANQIRQTVQATEFAEEMHPMCEAYLFASSRAHTVNTIVKPQVDKGNIVISDRSFITGLAFQGYARGLGIEQILRINQPIIDIIQPDMVIYLSLDPQVGLSRVFDHHGDKFESETIDFFQQAQKGYQQVAQLPIMQKIWRSIDVDQKDIPTVSQEILHVLTPLLDRIPDDVVQKETKRPQLPLD